MIEAHELSLTTRRLNLSLNYVLKLKSLPENPAYRCVFEPQNTKLCEESESKVPPPGIHILPHLEKSKFDLNLIDDTPLLDIVPWKLSVPAVRFDLTSFQKDTNPEIYKQLYLQVISEYPSSPTVLNQRKELLQWLYPLNKLKNFFYMSASRWQFSIYSRVEGYSFSSQTCLLFQRKIIFDIIWFPFIVSQY